MTYTSFLSVSWLFSSIYLVDRSLIQSLEYFLIKLNVMLDIVTRQN